MKKGLLIAALAITSFSYGQELSHNYYNYIMNRFNLNPAIAGNNGNISAMLNTKTYLSGFNGAPRNTMFGLHAPISLNQGAGLRVVSDRRGGFEVDKYDAAYSYQIQLDDRQDLRFGISAGAITRKLNTSGIDNIDLLNQNDPTLAGGYLNETNFIAGVGLVYDFDNLQVGLSAPHLIQGSEPISEFIVGSASYRYDFENSPISVTPTFIYQNIPTIENQFDVLLKGEYDEKVWAMAGYRSNNNLTFGLGFDLGPFGLGYAYEMSNSDLEMIGGGSHEIVIQVAFKSASQKRKTALVRTLDDYVARFDAMINDKDNKYNRAQVQTEIQSIRTELNKLEESNDKTTAKIVEKRLVTIEQQIIALEKKYAK
jgi:type IX secretion system PorP/SprF family membrane protein